MLSGQRILAVSSDETVSFRLVSIVPRTSYSSPDDVVSRATRDPGCECCPVKSIDLFKKLPFVLQLVTERNEAVRDLAEARLELAKLKMELASAEPLLDAHKDGRLIDVEYRYSPISRQWHGSPGPLRIRNMLKDGADRYLTLIDSFTQFHKEFARIPVHGDRDERYPIWVNGMLPALDSAGIYGLLATRNPPIYFEVGSGNSTKFARRAIDDHKLRTRIVSVDPQPRANIDAICDDVLRMPFEEVAVESLAFLPPESVVFVDNSHRSFQNSDVTVFFTEILSSLPANVIWGLHDIFLPDDYPTPWLDRYFNEQYLLMCYLLGGAGDDQIFLPNTYLSQTQRLFEHIERTLFARPPFAQTEKHGCCFWMLRTRCPNDSAGTV